MAMLMNNFVGDGNGYVGNLDLKPEVAYTVSASGDWHDAEQKDWRVKATGYYTYVQDYIDAQRCNFGQCGGAANVSATTGFVNLQYVNQSARLYGVDLSGSMQLGQSGDFGSFKGSGLLSYVRGKNHDHRRQPLQHHAAERQGGGDAEPGRLEQHRRSAAGGRQDRRVPGPQRSRRPPATACSTCAAATSGSSSGWTSASRTS